MNRKNLIILLLLVVVIGGAGVAMFMRDTQDWKAQELRLGAKLLPNLPVADVTEIFVKHKKDELTLVKEGEGWTLKERGGYPADGAAVAEFLLKARDWKVIQSEPIAENQRPRMEVAAPDAAEGAATLLEFRGKDGKPIATLFLGKKHLGKPPLQVKGFDKGQPDGRYLLVASDPKLLVVISDPLNNVEPKADKWQSKDFFKVDRIRTLAVDTGEVTASYRLEREQEAGDWKLAGLKPGETTDPSAAVTATNALYSMEFTEVAQIKPDRFQKPITVTAETFDGLTYLFKAVPKKAEGDELTFYVNGVLTGEVKRTERTPAKDEKPEEKEKRDKEHEDKFKRLEAQVAREKAMAPWVYVVDGKKIVPVLRDRSRFVEKPEPKAPPPAKK
jgi:hypothetical protein